MMIQKKHGRFNLFDLCLLVVLLAVIVGAFFYFIPPKNVSGMPASATFKLSGVRSELFDALYAGDTLYDASGNVVLGKIRKIDSAPDVLTIPPRDGDSEEIVAAYPEDTILSVTLTVRLDHATPIEGGFAVGSLQILTGENLRLRTANFSAVGTCESVVFSGEEAVK